jgi:hypothetical protein
LGCHDVKEQLDISDNLAEANENKENKLEEKVNYPISSMVNAKECYTNNDVLYSLDRNLVISELAIAFFCPRI